MSVISLCGFICTTEIYCPAFLIISHIHTQLAQQRKQNAILSTSMYKQQIDCQASKTRLSLSAGFPKGTPSSLNSLNIQQESAPGRCACCKPINVGNCVQYTWVVIWKFGLLTEAAHQHISNMPPQSVSILVLKPVRTQECRVWKVSCSRYISFPGQAAAIGQENKSS